MANSAANDQFNRARGWILRTHGGLPHLIGKLTSFLLPLALLLACAGTSFAGPPRIAYRQGSDTYTYLGELSSADDASWFIEDCSKPGLLCVLASGLALAVQVEAFEAAGEYQVGSLRYTPHCMHEDNSGACAYALVLYQPATSTLGDVRGRGYFLFPREKGVRMFGEGQMLWVFDSGVPLLSPAYVRAIPRLKMIRTDPSLIGRGYRDDR
jgi:hypothetical protein